MDSISATRRRYPLPPGVAALFLAPILFLAVCPAHAHRVGCFAAAEVKAVAGFAWTSGGGRLANVPFEVRSPDGVVLHSGRTDAQGEFRFVPTQLCDHEIVIDAGAGHVARFVVRTEDLPAAILPVSAVEPAGSDTPAPAEPEHANPDPPAAPSTALEPLVARVVQREVAPLRRELAELRDRRSLQDIVGGLGYIAGITGVAFYFLGSRRRPS